MANDEPLVSIIIDSYNYERYVGQAIQSALDQTYDRVEVVCVDDGSTDNSEAVIRQFKNVTGIFKPNGGQTSAVRAALPKTSGDIVIILDSDDFLLPHACATVVRHWAPGVSLVQYRLEKQDEHGRHLGYYPDHPYVRGYEKAFVLKYGFMPASPTSGNAFCRRHIFDRFRYNKDRDNISLDGYLVYTAPLAGNIVSLDDVLGVYRLHGKNLSMVAGVDLRRAKTRFATELAHRQGLAQMANMLSLSSKTAYDFLDPYSWQMALLIRRGYPQDAQLVQLDTPEIVRRGILGFVRFPMLTVWQRVKNIVGMLLVACGPRGLARRILPVSAP